MVYAQKTWVDAKISNVFISLSHRFCFIERGQGKETQIIYKK
jgi:hypothetical protein